MSRIVYFDCPSGASGDMILGALVDVGVSVEALRAELAKLGLHVPHFLRENGRRLDDPRSAKPAEGPGVPRRRREDFPAKQDPVLGIAR